MDPNAALRELLEALALPDPDRHEVYHRLDDLMQWVDRGGFLPTVKQLPAGWEDVNGKTHPGFAVVV